MPALFAFDRPDLDDGTVRAIAARHWGIGGDLTALRGERSHNTRITCSDGRGFVLQVQSASERPEVIDLQTRAMLHVAALDPSLPVSKVQPTRAGDPLASVDVGGRTHLARLVSYLPGTTFDNEQALSNDAYRAIGSLLGRLAAALASFEHPESGHFMPWDLGNGLIGDAGMRADVGPASRRSLDRIAERLDEIAATIGRLPTQTIHNDGHAGNLLRVDDASETVTGVIDFGDTVHTATAADVAIVAESFAPEQADPAGVTATLAAGYHEHHPLVDAEVIALPELVLARLALTVLLVEHQIRHVPHLARGAEHALPYVIERLDRWAAHDPTLIARRIGDAL